MANIKYVSYTGEEFDLSAFPVRLRQKTAGLYSYEWSPNVTNKTLGTRVNSFGKDAQEYEMTVDFTGNRSVRAASAQQFYELTERDVRTTTADSPTPGRLYLNDAYIECYIRKSEPVTYESNLRTVGKKFTVYVPYPFWIEEKEQVLEKYESKETSEYLDHDYDFDYDLTAAALGTLQTFNDNFVASEFQLTVYGPATNPYITVNDHIYRVNTTLLTGETLIVNSREISVTKYSTSGSKVNEINKRDKQNNLFQKIPAGSLVIGWTGDFKAKLVLLNERSEPRWT